MEIVESFEGIEEESIKGSEEYRFVKWDDPAQQHPICPFEKFNTWILKP